MPDGQIVAYRTPENRIYPRIVPASADRQWMDEGTRGWANRCLPLRIANANGWFILNPGAVEIEWNGNRAVEALKVKSLDGSEPLAQSMFGFGIVTFVIPYLFRTPEGMNLLTRGPANSPKDGICALDGIVETDWLPFTFTMNWQVTRPGKKIRFDKEEPIAMLMPLRRGDTEGLEPQIWNMESEPELLRRFETWLADRQAAQRKKEESHYEAKVKQGHYIRGEDHQGARAQQHQTKLAVKAFREMEAAPVLESPAAMAATEKPGFWKRYFGSSGISK